MEASDQAQGHPSAAGQGSAGTVPGTAAQGGFPATGRTADTPDPGDPTGPAAPAAPAAPADPVARRAAKANSGRGPRDMALSLLVLLVPIALLLAFYRLVLGGDQPVVVDPAPALDQARSAAVFPVAEPTGLGAGWRPVAARFERRDGYATLRIGYVTPSGGGAQVVQGNAPADKLLGAELSTSARPGAETTVGDRAWRRYTSGRGEQALVLVERNRAVIVIGAVGEQEVRDLAGALRTAGS